LLLLTIIFGVNPQIAFGIDTSKQYFLDNKIYSNIINDASFTDTNSMSVSDIQKFLDDKDSPLKNYSESGRSAAQIIYDAAHGKNEAAGDWGGISINDSTGTISPRVILVYLEKEQSLISRDDLPADTLSKAMGYQCYGGVSNDNNLNNCNDRYEGFAVQVENAAWQLRYNFEYSKRGYKPLGFTIHYVKDEKASMPDEYGNSYDVTMTTNATSAIYGYTPFVFDSAYNFWKFFNEWFTKTAEPDPKTLPPTPNDTAKFVENTYINTTTVGGVKSSGDSVFFNNQLIQGPGTTNWQLTFETWLGDHTYYVEYRSPAGAVVDRKELQIHRHGIADINGDGKVDIQDLSILATYWGQEHPAEPLANLNPGDDEVVDILDLSILASNWNG